MNTDNCDRQSSVVRFFLQHVVPIQLRFAKGGETQHRIISSFLLSVQDQWLLVTAGHCVKAVEENRLNGWQVDRAWLIDCISSGAIYHHPVPFDWHAALPVAPFKDRHNDFGLLLIDGLARQQLAANGMRPITEQAWDFEPPDPIGYVMVGVPSELSKVDEPVSNLSAVVLAVSPAASRPPELEESVADRWYGHVGMPDSLSDIDGMSGGPIFGLRTNERGEMRYWLHAVQSAWIGSTRAIAACPMRPLARLLSEVMDGRRAV